MQQTTATVDIDHRSLDAVPNAPARDEPVGFLLRLAKALHTYGLPAYELEQTMNGCADALGYGIQCMSLPTSISMTFLTPEGEVKTYLIRVAPGDVNLAKLHQTTDIAKNVISGSLSSQQGAELLKQVATEPSAWPQWLIVLAFAMVSTGIARIFSAGPDEMMAAFLVGGVVGLLSVIARQKPLLNHLLPAISAFLATMLAFFLNDFTALSIQVSVVVVSGLIVLLPGLSLTIAMAELATQNMVSGTARLTGAATVFIQLAFGSALGVEISGHLGFSQAAVTIEPVAPWSIWLAATLAAIALVPLFEARKQDIGWFLLASLSAFTTVQFASAAFGSSLGAFTGAITIGVLANLASRIKGLPGATIMMPGFIILVPGSVGYRSILALVDKDIVGGLETAFDVAIIGVSLVAGFLIASMVQLPKHHFKDHF